MYFERFFEPELAQASYLIGCETSGEAIVVDPSRDVDGYLACAEHRGLRIRYTTETHVHADFLSGCRELAAATGAEILLSAEGDAPYAYSHAPLRNGDVVEVGQVRLEARHTPGHTPEHVSFLVADASRAEAAALILSGDALFVGDVGRPDLLEKAVGVGGTARAMAHDLYRTVRYFATLPDWLQVWPGHGAGSACGKSLGAMPASTIGYERRTNWALLAKSEERFTESVLEGQPDVPSYFSRMKSENARGPRIVGRRPALPRLSVDAAVFSDPACPQIVDVRSAEAFSHGHLSGSVSVPRGSSFTTWAAAVLDPGMPVALVGDAAAADACARALLRVGIDDLVGYLSDLGDGDAEDARTSASTAPDSRSAPAGRIAPRRPRIATVQRLDAAALRRRLHAGSTTAILDVRSSDEFASGHIPGSVNVPLARLVSDLRDRGATAVAGLARNGSPLVVHCEHGDRASTAASLFLRAGVENFATLTGGIAAWRADQRRAGEKE